MDSLSFFFQCRLALDEKKALMKAIQESEAKAADEKRAAEEGKEVKPEKKKDGLDLSDLEDLPPVPTRPDDPTIIFKGRPMYITVRCPFFISIPA